MAMVPTPGATAPAARGPQADGDDGRVDLSPGWWRGWWRGAAACPSPNHGPRPEGVAVTLVVLHSISLPPGRYDGEAVAELFTNRLDCDAHPYYERLRGLQVSAHFLVRRNGAVLQFVDVTRRAWHAGVSSWRGRDHCNDWSVGIELEGLEGDRFEPAQYRALGPLLAALRQRLPVAEVVGHEHVAPGRKQDPGPGFDWAALVTSAAWPPGLACGVPGLPSQPAAHAAA